MAARSLPTTSFTKGIFGMEDRFGGVRGVRGNAHGVLPTLVMTPTTKEEFPAQPEGDDTTEDELVGAQPEDEETTDDELVGAQPEDARPAEWYQRKSGSLAHYGMFEPAIPFTHQDWCRPSSTTQSLCLEDSAFNPSTWNHSCRFTDKFTGKNVITLDSEEDGVITAQFTDPIRGP